MNILHVISSVNPAGGGPIESLTRVAEIMARDGHSTDVLSLDAPGASWLDNLPCMPSGRERVRMATRRLWFRGCGIMPAGTT
jgi:hypothetical protein